MQASEPRLPIPPLHPYTGTDVARLLTERAAEHPDDDFVTWQPFEGAPRTWTYAVFLAEVRAVAAGLQERGIGAGDRVVIHLENCPEFLLAWFACAQVHAVAVTTNARASEDELRYYIEDSGATAAITQPRFASLLGAAGPALAFVAAVDQDPGVPLGEPALPLPAGVLRFDELYADPRRLLSPPAEPGAPLSIQYTSGTTARPKGVLWTHANGLWAGQCNATHEGLRKDDVHLTYMPLFHTNAMAYSVLASLWVGARFVLIHKWSTSRFWEISLAHGCTWLSLMGLSLRAVLAAEAPPEHDYRCFGSPVVAPFQELFGVECVTWWGMTETVSHGICSSGRLPAMQGSIGRPAPEYDIRVSRPDGSPVGCGETGELFVRGVRGISMFAEYWNNPEATRSGFDAEGWFATGDLVRLNDDGTLTFVDRLKDMLKVGAENVAASEIERVIAALPEVGEVAVVAAPDSKLDQVPVAFVVPADDGVSGAPTASADVEARLAAVVTGACRDLLADFKVPREVYVVRALPRSTISKINKADLRRFVVGEDDHRDLRTAESAWAAAQVADPSGDAS
ncbi:AMP-binding protein [Nocardioides insulae]|uniref:AMP-binding protein n=1 Tax=Nocardioides insulae TaxID=394734 RepID=UPI00040CEE4A|nr:AMP-binding protein [Nocardioides insulae]